MTYDGLFHNITFALTGDSCHYIGWLYVANYGLDSVYDSIVDFFVWHVWFDVFLLQHTKLTSSPL